MRHFKVLVTVFVGAMIARCDAGEILVTKDIPYRAPSARETDQCKMDLYVPKGKKDIPFLLWLHGGSLTTGTKDTESAWATALARHGIGVAMANYRLSPDVKYPTYIEDAAAAFAWLYRHAGEYGGNPRLVFIGGHSAGGYLTAMIGMNSDYLKNEGLSTDAVAGFIPLSAQVTTHFTVRAERGLGKDTIVADEAAPIYYTRKDTPPLLLMVGDNDFPGRTKENDYFYEVLKIAGNKNVSFKIFQNRDHGSINSRMAEQGDPVTAALLSFIRNISEKRSGGVANLPVQ